MKDFLTVEFDAAQCRKELDRFKALLESNTELSERNDLQKLFTECPQLFAFIASSIPNIGLANRLAFQFQIFGDFSADLVVGNFERKTYFAIELEDARQNSIFNKQTKKSTSDWGSRFEHGFSQLVDWFFSFDDHRNSAQFAKNFGYGHIEFFGLLLIGRSSYIAGFDETRLRWRSDRVTINTHKIYCRTYDDLYEDLNRDWRLYTQVTSQS